MDLVMDAVKVLLHSPFGTPYEETDLDATRTGTLMSGRLLSLGRSVRCVSAERLNEVQPAFCNSQWLKLKSSGGAQNGK